MAEKRISLKVYMRDDLVIRSRVDTVENEAQLENFKNILKDFKKLNYLSMDTDEGEVFFNPQHIMAVTIVNEDEPF